MTDIQTSTVPAPLPHAVRKMLPSLLLFSVVLLGLLTLCWALVLPRYTSLELDGSMLPAAQVPVYAYELESKIELAEAARDALTLPPRDETYIALRDRVRAHVSLADIEADIASMLSKTDYGQFVVITAMRMTGGKVELEGDVRHAGPRSMTLLATFVDELAAQPFVTELVPPAFTREDDPKIGPHSPFVIRFNVVSR